MSSRKHRPTLDSVNSRNIQKSREASDIERMRARRHLERIAQKKQADAQVQGILNMETDTGSTKPKRKHTRGGVLMPADLRDPLVDHINKVGVDEAAEDMENIEPSRKGSTSARDAIRVLLRDTDHRWAHRSIRGWRRTLAYWSQGKRPHELLSRGIDLIVNGEVVTGIGETVRGGSTTVADEANSEPEQGAEPAPEPDPVSEPEQPAQPETQPGQSIVSIDGFDFCVASDSRDVRITSEELAAKLGYGKRRDLEALALRHSEFLNKFGGVRTVRIPCRAGARGWDTTDVDLYNRKQVLYLIAKSERKIANELTVRLIGAFDKLLEMNARGNASQAQPPHQNVSLATEVTAAMAPMFSMMLESQARTNEMFLKAIAELRHAPSDHFEAKPFSELSQGHQAAIIANMVRTHADQLASEGIPNEYSVAWNILYSQYEEDTGDLVRKIATAESDSRGSRVRPFDLLKREGKLVQLMESARKVFFRTKH